METPEPNYGQHDATFSEAVSRTTGKFIDSVSHAFHPIIEKYAQLFKTGVRTPVLRRPGDVGLDYEDVFFQSMDGIPLEGWFIPADSDKLLIVNHPMACNRYGFPGHLAPWNTMFGGFEVNFLPELKHLHDAGYNILTYDLRNCGLSGQANGGISGFGLLECRDVVGAVRYARARKDLVSMATGLYGRCVGGNATIIAMAKWPAEFTHIQTIVLLNVVSGRTFIEKAAEDFHLDPDRTVMGMDKRLRELTGFHLNEETPRPYAMYVQVPTLMAQLRRDFLIYGEKDGSEIFQAIGSHDKELLWIDDSNRRFYAYNHFGRYPEQLIAWFDRHMARH